MVSLIIRLFTLLLQVSLLCPSEIEKIRLPNNTKTVKDLCILPNGLVALASLGRKLAVFRLLLHSIFLPAKCKPIQSSPPRVNSNEVVFEDLQLA